MKAVRIVATGPPDVLRVAEVNEPAVQRDQVVIRVRAAGVNYIDTYQRSGLYTVPLPYIPGLEGAGEVIEVGKEVTELAAGARVAFCSWPGAYAEQIAVPLDRVVPIPREISYEDAAALLLQGMTAHFLVNDCYQVREGTTCLVHAAAGGVGLLLTQFAKARGARVLGTVSTHEKAKLAKRAGVDEVILYTEHDFREEVMRLTGGKGVEVVYDSVGKETFDRSLSSLTKRGHLVLFGQSSGPVPPFNPALLGDKGSLFLTRPRLFDYIGDRETLLGRASAVFEEFIHERLKLFPFTSYPLAEAAKAHIALEGRKTSGKVLLVP